MQLITDDLKFISHDPDRNLVKIAYYITITELGFDYSILIRKYFKQHGIDAAIIKEAKYHTTYHVMCDDEQATFIRLLLH